MKRKNNLHNKIINTNNLILAHNRAKKGKKKYKAIIDVDKNLNSHILKLNQLLISKSHKTSKYSISTKIEGGKERVIYKLPYFPDRILHHAILQIIQPILEKTYIKDTYQSIKGRGIHKAKKRMQFFLNDTENTTYCLKLDVKKYYPSVDNKILKELIRKKIKCKDTLSLIDEIINSTKGLPIGNYTSQTFGNFYLSYFDHWLKEDKKVKYYVRYADDLTILHKDKNYLHKLKQEIEYYLKNKLNLKLKENWQVFPVHKRGVDFLGFKFYHTHTLLRNNIKKSFVKSVKKCNNINSIMSYYGWIKASDSYNLMRKNFTKDFLSKSELLCSKSKIKNPIKNIVIIRKKRYNQLKLF